jgi:hypothetical protein
MNKLKASKKDMRSYDKILSVGYCGLQSLLNRQYPIAYSSGVYGWACDYYYIDGVLISTGYNPLNSKGLKSDYALIKDYNDKARLVLSSTYNYDNATKALNILLSEFIQAIKGGV